MAKISRDDTDKGKFATLDLDANLTIRDDDGNTRPYALTKLETENTEFNRVDIATATVVATETDYYLPEFEDPIDININGVDVYSGYVGGVEPKDEIAFELKCFNATRKLKRTNVNVGIEGAHSVPSKLIENTIMPKTGISDYEININSDIRIEDGESRQPPNQPEDNAVNFSATEMSAMDVIERLAKATESLWWVDGTGMFHFGQPDSDVYELAYVKDASAGKVTPPYRSVKVVGGGEASNTNWSEAQILAKEPVVEKRSLKNAKLAGEKEKIKEQEGEDFDEEEDLNQKQRDAYEVLIGELKEPVFIHRDKSIKSKTEAEAVANSIINELLRQTMQGYVKIVGWAGIEPFDIIEMPDFLGGESYLVQGVKHTLDASKGFETRVEVGGLINRGDEGRVFGVYNK